MRNALNVDQCSAASEVEDRFKIEFSDTEVEQIITVSDLYTLLLQKFPPNEDSPKCASAMAFYRLRRALSDERPQNGSTMASYRVRLLSDQRPRKELSPSFDLTSLKGLSARELFKYLEQATGLTLPPCKTDVGNTTSAIGAFGSIGSIASDIRVFGSISYISGLIVALVVLFEVSVLYGVLIGIVGIVAGSIAIRFAEIIDRHDPGVIPDSCRTLGDLSRRTALLNYASLAKSGAARNKKAIWSVFTELLSERLLFEGEHVAASEIGYETRFFDWDTKAAGPRNIG